MARIMKKLTHHESFMFVCYCNKNDIKMLHLHYKILLFRKKKTVGTTMALFYSVNKLKVIKRYQNILQDKIFETNLQPL